MDNILWLLGGAVVGVVVMFFVANNNPAWISGTYRKLKAEFDENEKKLREFREDLRITEKVKEAINSMTKKL